MNLGTIKPDIIEHHSSKYPWTPLATDILGHYGDSINLDTITRGVPGHHRKNNPETP
jgi:hypothetical protein